MKSIIIISLLFSLPFKALTQTPEYKHLATKVALTGSGSININSLSQLTRWTAGVSFAFGDFHYGGGFSKVSIPGDELRGGYIALGPRAKRNFSNQTPNWIHGWEVAVGFHVTNNGDAYSIGINYTPISDTNNIGHGVRLGLEYIWGEGRGGVEHKSFNLTAGFELGYVEKMTVRVK